MKKSFCGCRDGTVRRGRAGSVVVPTSIPAEFQSVVNYK
jgi:hypothetical protein